MRADGFEVENLSRVPGYAYRLPPSQAMRKDVAPYASPATPSLTLLLLDRADFAQLAVAIGVFSLVACRADTTRAAQSTVFVYSDWSVAFN